MVKYRMIVIKLPSCDTAKVTPDCCAFLYINHLNLILIYSLWINGVSHLQNKTSETWRSSHSMKGMFRMM